MDKCDNHVAEYITKVESDKLIAEAVAKSIELHQEHFVNEQADLILRYSRADKFITLILSRIVMISEKNTSFGDWAVFADWAQISNLDKPSLLMLEEIDNVLQMGFDFQILLNTMKKDEILEKQWKSIVMMMRLIGYDAFDGVKF